MVRKKTKRETRGWKEKKVEVKDATSKAMGGCHGAAGDCCGKLCCREWWSQE